MAKSFTSNEELIQRSKSAPNGSDTESRSQTMIYQKIFRKSHSVDEQKVPGSPNDGISSENTTPTDSVENSDCFPGFRKYQREDKVGSERSPVLKEEVGDQHQSPTHGRRPA